MGTPRKLVESECSRFSRENHDEVPHTRSKYPTDPTFFLFSKNHFAIGEKYLFWYKLAVVPGLIFFFLIKEQNAKGSFEDLF